jgi:hypothetical protein
MILVKLNKMQFIILTKILKILNKNQLKLVNLKKYYYLKTKNKILLLINLDWMTCK